MATAKKKASATRAKPVATVAAASPLPPFGALARAATKQVNRAATKAAPQTVHAAAKKASTAAQPLAKAASGPMAEKTVKAKKPKLVRDSFTIPKAEYGVLEDLKQRAGSLARPVKKSELLRAGIKALAAMPETAFLAALQAVPAIKTGRPIKA